MPSTEDLAFAKMDLTPAVLKKFLFDWGLCFYLKSLPFSCSGTFRITNRKCMPEELTVL